MKPLWKFLYKVPVADPGEGPGHGEPSASYFWTKLRPKGLKEISFKTGSPLSQGLDDPPPPPQLSEGLDPPLSTYIYMHMNNYVCKKVNVGGEIASLK